jgi:hypothetical protein
LSISPLVPPIGDTPLTIVFLVVNDPELFSSLHKQHGSVLKIWMGPTQLLVSIFDVRIVNELLEKAHDRVPAPRMALQLAFGKGSLFFAPFSKVCLYPSINWHTPPRA